MRRLLPVFVVVFIVAGILAVPVSAGSSPPTVTYTVQPGDTLTSISRQFCTSRQVIYALNKATIGPNPDELEPGMVLQIPNGCGGSPPACSGDGQCGGQPPQCNVDGQCGGQPPPCNVDGQCGQPPPCSVYDRGPTLHARGPVHGNIYTIMLGDTSFSISRRFGLTVGQLSAANGIADPYRIYAGQTLVIPGLGSCPPPPGKPFITIGSPTPGAQLPPSFGVSGTGGGLFEGSVVVRALNGAGQVLAEVPTTLQGANVGAGGAGTYSVQLTVHVSANTPGTILAFSTSPKDGKIVASASVPVTFTASSPTYKDYAPGQCKIRGKPGAPFYVFPGGPQAGYFGSGAVFNAMRGAKSSGETWYQISTDPGTGTPWVWVPSSSTSAASGGCAF
jgi:LysM repeat protein